MTGEEALKVIQANVKGCREEVADGGKCWKPAEYVLWGKLVPNAGLGPRCYDHAATHVGHRALAPGANYALINLYTLARDLAE